MAARSSLLRGTVVNRCFAFADRLGQRALAISAERLDLGAASRDLGDAIGLGGIAHHQRRLGIADEIVELVERIGGVERQIDRAGTHGGEIEHQCCDGFFSLRCNAVADFDPARHQHIRHLPGASDQVGIADARAVELFDRKPVGIVEVVEQAGKQVGVGSRVHATIPDGRWPDIPPAGLAKTPQTKQRRQFA